MSVAATNYITTIPPPSWIPSNAPTTDWSGIASSSNGQNMAAVTTSGTIYTSTTSGQTWSLMYTLPPNPPNPPNPFTSIASSSNGQILYATSPNSTGTGGVFVSTNGGVNWTTISSLQTYPNNWIDVSCDGTGQNVVVSGWYLISPPIISGVYYSTNYGSSFTPINPSSVNLRFGSITSNTGSGQYVAVVTTSFNGGNGGIYYSSNYGANWAQSVGAPFSANDYLNIWTSIDSDSTGQYMAATYGGTTSSYFGVWLSTNYGANWTQSSLTQNNLASIASSSNGSILITCRNGVDGVEQIWISTNYGANWTGISTLLACLSITINYSGTLSAVGTSGIYYYNNYSIYGTPDLADLFQALPSGVTPAPITNYTVPTLGDLNNVFAPISIGTPISSNTRYTVSNTDLTSIFAAKIFTTSTAGIYSATYSGGYYTVTLTGNGTITFVVSVLNGSYVVVGGGGGGGSGNGDDNINPIYAGGGASGGEVTYISSFNPSLNTPINVTIGNGGLSDNSGGSSSFNGTTSIGGNPGSGNNGGASVNGGGGGGGIGAIATQFYILQNAANGTNGVTNTLGTFGGCGGGGGAEDNNFSPNVANPGTGGSGGGANGGSAYNSGNNGIPNTGGGGGGGGQVFFYQSAPNSGGTGGSGVVIIKFQYP